MTIFLFWLIGYVGAYIFTRLYCFINGEKWTLGARFSALKYSLLSYIWMASVVLCIIIDCLTKIKVKIDMDKEVKW
jgi:hypothetical protein